MRRVTSGAKRHGTRGPQGRRTFHFGKRIVHLVNAPKNQRIGMEEIDDGLWQLYFHSVLLATFDERDYIIESRPTCDRCCRTAVSPMYPSVQCSKSA